MDSDEGTLAGASGQAVEKFLSRKRNRGQGRGQQDATGGGSNFLAAAGDVSLLPKGPQSLVQDGACGAPAIQHAPEEVDAQASARPAGRSRVEDAPAGIVPWLPVQGDADAEEDEWEDHSDLEDMQYNEEGVPTTAGEEHSSIVISFEKDAKGGGRASRQHRFTAEDRLAAAVVHQSHLLCLLARGHLYDLAAADPLVQAVASSLAPEDRLQSLHPKEGMVVARLTSLVEWYKDFVQQSGSEKVPSDEELKEADSQGGVAATAVRLQVVAAQRAGSAEELVALYAALLRSQGLLVRFVRALDPLPQRPMLRDRRYVPTVPRRPSTAAPRKRKNAETEGAAATGKKARAASGAAGRGRNRKRGTKKGKVEEIELESAEASSDSEDVADEEGMPSGKGTPITQKPGRAAQRGKGGRGSSKRKNANDADADFQAPDDTGPSTASRTASRKTRASKRSTGEEGAQQGSAESPSKVQDIGECAADAEEGIATGKGDQLKRRGDLEFENQLAMAMMASTSGSLPQPEDSKGGKLGDSTAKGELRRGKAHGTGWTSARSLGRSQAADTWVEVYCDGEDEGRGRWVHVQPLLGWIDRPKDVERASARYAPLAYVVAFAGGGAKDVTVRYVQNMVKAEKVRGKNGKWWHRTLKPLRSAEVDATRKHLEGAAPTAVPDAAVSGAAGGTEAAAEPGQGKESSAKLEPKAKPAKRAKLSHSEERLTREDKVLQAKRKEDDQAVPTTVDGFKRHKVYVLERHIGRYSALRPGAPRAGMHRGEAFYRAEEVSELHTAEKWVLNGREVCAGELAQPFKTVAKRGTKGKGPGAGLKDAGEFEEGGGEAETKDDNNQTKLYGLWQTEPWQAPAAQGGIVPKNERGTVLCPPMAPSLPLGTVQVNLPRVVAICKKWNVDYGMAMTGFDIHGGRSVPHFEGIIICEEFEEVVRTEWRNEQQEQAEKAAAKRLEFARVTWGNLLNAIFTRLGLQDSKAAPGATKSPAKQRSAKQGRKAPRKSVDDNGSVPEDAEELSMAAQGAQAKKPRRSAKKRAVGEALQDVNSLEVEEGNEQAEGEREGWEKTKTGVLAEVEEI